jgi:DNA double-strand break repair helicase HerA and related ATPase
VDEQGASQFFGEPMLNVDDLIQTSIDGRGVVNVLTADRLLNAPKLYASFLLWLLSELYERLPEVGDPQKPVIVLFFDEAHLLFDDAPDVLVEKIEQVVRLIRSKGVGVYFVTQNPLDIPETILGQLGNRVQHALRAFTPRDQKAVRAAAQTMRQNPAIKTEQVISELAVGEALVSLLDERGAPGMVDRAWILPPASRIGPLAAEERAAVLQASVLRGHYEQAVDRESAYEKLKAAAEAGQTGQGTTPGPLPRGKTSRTADAGGGSASAGQSLSDLIFGSTGPRGGRHEGMLESAARSASRSIGSGLGRQILRGMLGGILGGRR